MTRAVADLVHEHLGTLRPSERKVARALLADYPRRGLQPAAGLAAAAGVSAPTVVRFAAALGYDGYAALQAALLDEIGRATPGPLPRVEHGQVDADLSQAADILLAGARDTITELNRAEWDEALGLLADPRRRITTTGGRSTMVLAEMLAATLEMVRDDVHLLSDPGRRETAHLLRLDRRDVLVAFDVPRYQQTTIEVVDLARRRRSAVVLVTDPRLSPAARHADVVLPVSVTSPTPFAALTASTLVVELLVGGVQHRLGSAATRRLQAWEEFRRREVVGSGAADR